MCLIFYRDVGEVLFMNREQILEEIARLDEEINRVLASAQLPKLEHRPFPLGLWALTGLSFAWWKYGDYLPGAYIYHFETAQYGFYLGIVFAVIAVLSSISWLIRGRGYGGKSEAYRSASRNARELQERRRELQAELKSLSEH